MPTADRTFVQAIAMLHPVASLADARALSRLDADAVIVADRLARAAVIEVNGDHLAIRDDAVREGAIALLDRSERSLWHTRAAELCDAAMLSDTEKSPGQTVSLTIAAAEHRIAAGDRDAAANVARRASGRLVAAGHPGEASDLLRRVATLLADPDLARELQLMAMETGSLAGRVAATITPNVRHHRPRRTRVLRAPELEDRWQTRVDVDLLEAARRTSSTHELPIGERMRAVLVAVACAEALGGEHALDDVRDVLNGIEAPRDLAPPSRDEHIAVLRARMAFHVSVGVLTLGVTAARELEAQFDARPLTPELFLTLQNVAEALRVAGLPDAGALLFERAYSAGRRLGTPTLAARAAERLACIALQRSAPGDARRWLEHADRCGSLAASPRWTRELRDTNRRVRMLEFPREENAAEALTAWEQSMHVHPTTPREGRAIATTAAEALIACGMRVPASLMQVLQRSHARFRTRTGHDRTAAALTRALLAEDRPADATRLARRYVAVERRAMGPAPRVLRDLCDPRRFY